MGAYNHMSCANKQMSTEQIVPRTPCVCGHNAAAEEWSHWILAPNNTAWPQLCSNFPIGKESAILHNQSSMSQVQDKEIDRDMHNSHLTSNTIE